MFKNMENLKIIDILRGPASKYKEFKCRQNHAFVFKISGESIYHFEDSVINHSAGELLFIPKGAKYSVRCSCQNSEYMLINFEADFENIRERKFALHNFPQLEYICNNLERLWFFGGESGYYKCLCAFYDVLSFITQRQNTDYSMKKSYSKILKGAQYLEENIFSCNLKVETLSSICNMSDTHFREIFKANFGLKPREYIQNKRLARALSIIESGEYERLSEVAFMCGYDDPLYFSKAFKEKYKVCPSKYGSID